MESLDSSDIKLAILFTKSGEINKQSLSQELKTSTLHNDTSESIYEIVFGIGWMAAKPLKLLE